ncbi:Asp/Glu/hydantoin racemase [Uliginosibacterium sp. TH139]|uniref:maleate cis-trans isomerase family protein n=1 Tax=Uliginosibacterium sp. TH139 TaxID=2067453 RepID=UPI000C7A0836|nr:Asp/Glu/hydantoin racemase [Uliginosibacterium sp. TH139]PLK48100.1 Asp/Glu/hydantoin racemase [Uliginosibacterium sp. TH139]
MAPSASEAYTAQQRFIGVITPSGNTVVERITLGILRDVPEVSPHFSRTPVFGSTDPSPTAYAQEGFLAAAALLAHAKPEVLVWNGSKGAGIGFAHDAALAAAIEQQTGIPATTSILGLKTALALRGITRIAVVTPYSDAGQQGALDCLHTEGYDCIAEAHAGYSDNLSYASVPLAQIADMMRSVAAARPQAIVTLCTNFPAAVLAAPMEVELGIPVFDTTALGVWAALHAIGADMHAAAPRWGSLFA